MERITKNRTISIQVENNKKYKKIFKVIKETHKNDFLNEILSENQFYHDDNNSFLCNEQHVENQNKIRAKIDTFSRVNFSRKRKKNE